jgi:hypothetical protein
VDCRRSLVSAPRGEVAYSCAPPERSDWIGEKEKNQGQVVILRSDDFAPPVVSHCLFDTTNVLQHTEMT